MEYFTSDTHFGHTNVIKYCNRPFDNAHHMNEGLIFKWNSVVKKDDVVYHLGDFGFQKPADLKDILYKLNGKVLLIPGNHDSNSFINMLLCQDMNKVEVLPKYHEFNNNGRKVVLCHYPIESWNNMSHGSIHLHGHSHGAGRKQAGRFDVGVDACDYEPKPLDYFLELYSKQGTPSRPEKYMKED